MKKLLKIALFFPMLAGSYLTGGLPVAKAANGCGEGTFTGKLVPNNPTGASFQNACNNHDNCYDTLGTPKSVCDKNFHKDTLAHCARTYNTIITLPLRRTCNGVSDAYYTAVLEKGGTAYQAAQKAAQARALGGSVNANIKGIALYRDILGREPEPGAVDGLVSRLASGRTLAQERETMANSEESRNNLANLYRDILGREPEPGAVDGLVSRLTSGRTLAQEREIMANSKEAQNRSQH